MSSSLKHASWLCTIRPRCGLYPDEIDKMRQHMLSLNPELYLYAVEDAGLGLQGKHIHMLFKLRVACRKDNLKRSFVNACLSNRTPESYLGGLDFQPVTNKENWRYYIGYLQKECGYLEKLMTEGDMAIGMSYYLETLQKRIKGRTVGQIILTQKNYGAFIMNYMDRSPHTDPLEAFHEMLASGRYSCAFATKSQRYMLLQHYGNPKSEGPSKSLLKHILHGCHHICDGCHKTMAKN